MKFKVCLFSLLLIFLFPFYSFATTSYNVDLDAVKGMSDRAKAEYLDSLVKKYVDGKEPTSVIPKVTSGEAKEWASLISHTIKTICDDLSVSVNTFIQTDAGKITVFLIAYKVVGQDVKNIVLGSAAWFVITILLIIMFYILVIPKKFVSKDDKKKIIDVVYKPRLDFSREARGSIAVIIALMFTITTLVTLIIVF